MQPALHRLCRRAELFSAIELNCWYCVFTLRVEETWKAADSINAADAAAAAAAAAAAKRVGSRRSSGPDAVTRWVAGGNPGVPKRVENEISLFWRGPPASLRTFVIRALP